MYLSHSKHWLLTSQYVMARLATVFSFCTVSQSQLSHQERSKPTRDKPHLGVRESISRHLEMISFDLVDLDPSM